MHNTSTVVPVPQEYAAVSCPGTQQRNEATKHDAASPILLENVCLMFMASIKKQNQENREIRKKSSIRKSYREQTKYRNG